MRSGDPLVLASRLPQSIPALSRLSEPVPGTAAPRAPSTRPPVLPAPVLPGDHSRASARQSRIRRWMRRQVPALDRSAPVSPPRCVGERGVGCGVPWGFLASFGTPGARPAPWCWGSRGVGQRCLCTVLFLFGRFSESCRHDGAGRGVGRWKRG